MQIHFNGTNFFNARLMQRIFSVWPVAQPVVGEMEMHSVANLATLQTPLATFFPSKKRPNLFSENHRYCRASARSCSPSARTPLSHSLFLSLCICSVQRAHLSLSVRLLCSALALSLCVSALFSARSRSLTLSLSLCASALFSAHTPLPLCVCSVSL